MSSMELVVTKLAYAKLFLHLAKYPHSACNGVFLSRKSSPTKIELVDCIPLFHSSLSLAPGVEIALNQIDSYCQHNDLDVGGYYHANENVNDNQHNQIVYKLAEKLKENCSYSLVFMINNHKIHPSNKEPCFSVLNFSDQRLKEFPCSLKLDENVYDSCQMLLREKRFNAINDFDNHLDDLNADWKNAQLNKVISVACETIATKN